MGVLWCFQAAFGSGAGLPVCAHLDSGWPFVSCYQESSRIDGELTQRAPSLMDVQPDWQIRVEPNSLFLGSSFVHVASDRRDGTNEDGWASHIKSAKNAFYVVDFLQRWSSKLGFDEHQPHKDSGDPVFVRLNSDKNSLKVAMPGESPQLNLAFESIAHTAHLTISNEAGELLEEIPGASSSKVREEGSLTGALFAENTFSAGVGCKALEGGEARGKILIVRRGKCTFTQKHNAAVASEASGLIVVWNDDPAFLKEIIFTKKQNIPTIAIRYSDGENLLNLLREGSKEIQAIITLGNVSHYDSGHSSMIVAHEWGHILWARLNGTSYSGQPKAMTEGTGDFIALLLGVKESDRGSKMGLQGAFPVVGVTSHGSKAWRNFGQRRIPYSTDFGVNGLTFKHITQGVQLPAHNKVAFGKNGARNAQEHNAGEIWALALWEAFVALAQEEPLDVARDTIMGYLIKGFKAMPKNSPTFMEARDGIINSIEDATHKEIVFNAFAKRGMGCDAKSPYRWDDGWQDEGRVSRNPTGFRGAVESFAKFSTCRHNY